MKKLLSIVLSIFSYNAVSDAKNYVFTSNGMQLLKYEEDLSSLQHSVDLNPLPPMDPNNPQQMPPMPGMQPPMPGMPVLPWNILDIKANNDYVFILMMLPAMSQNPPMPYDPNNPMSQMDPQLRIYSAHDLHLVHIKDLQGMMPMDKFDVNGNIVKIYINNQMPNCPMMPPQNPMPPMQNPCMMTGLDTFELTFASDGAGGLNSTERHIPYDYSKIYFFHNGNTIIDDLPPANNMPNPPMPNPMPYPNPMFGFANKMIAFNNNICGLIENVIPRPNQVQKGVWLQDSNNACQRHYHDLSGIDGDLTILESSPHYIYAGNFGRIHLLDPSDLSLKIDRPYISAQWFVVADITE